ncbi:KRSC protein, partial [Anseranas semipalmata]|nr:KRSC protein [Anseranas semipalmata]
MFCYDLCYTNSSGINRPQLLADSRNEPCFRQCPDSTALVQPFPAAVTFTGPILSSFPQDSFVGSSRAPVFGGYGGLTGSRSYGGLYGYGG